ncbi:hypothetical protein [Prosthecobacter sp.]|jgi:hypothetical protein|uniref:hypothetical protein n=1 Tax=Prosthecobacter sp. TaxID=1965333 RepID=UPI0037C5F515
MKRWLTILITTCIVGFGVSFGLFIITTIHGLLGEANEPLFWKLSISSRLCGWIAAGFWAMRRIRRRTLSFGDSAFFFFGAVSLSYLGYLTFQ